MIHVQVQQLNPMMRIQRLTVFVFRLLQEYQDDLIGSCKMKDVLYIIISCAKQTQVVFIFEPKQTSTQSSPVPPRFTAWCWGGWVVLAAVHHLKTWCLWEVQPGLKIPPPTCDHPTPPLPFLLSGRAEKRCKRLAGGSVSPAASETALVTLSWVESFLPAVFVSCSSADASTILNVSTWQFKRFH